MPKLNSFNSRIAPAITLVEGVVETNHLDGDAFHSGQVRQPGAQNQIPILSYGDSLRRECRRLLQLKALRSEPFSCFAASWIRCLHSEEIWVSGIATNQTICMSRKNEQYIGRFGFTTPLTAHSSTSLSHYPRWLDAWASFSFS